MTPPASSALGKAPAGGLTIVRGAKGAVASASARRRRAARRRVGRAPGRVYGRELAGGQAGSRGAGAMRGRADSAADPVPPSFRS
jgi:hypothetical protein